MAVTGLEGLAGPLREPRAARPRRVAQASASRRSAQRPRRARAGRARAGTASHARLRNAAVGVGSRLPCVLGRCQPRPLTSSVRVYLLLKVKRPGAGSVTGGAEPTPAIVPASVSATSSHSPRSAATSTSAEPDGDRAGREERRTAPLDAAQARAARRRAERGRSSRTRAKRTRNSTPRHSHTSGAAASSAAVRERLGHLGRQLARLRERLARAPRARAPTPCGGVRPADELGGAVELVLERRAGVSRSSRRRSGSRGERRRGARASARGRSRDRPSRPRKHAATRCRASASQAARS